MKSQAARIATLKESIFSTFAKKVVELKGINPAQGFPSFDGPEFIKEAAKKAIENGHNQYAPSFGIPELRQKIKETYQSQYNLSVDETLITSGATEAIYLTLQALINPGDEVVVFEPVYDSYIAGIEMAGGIPRPVTLKAPEFKFDEKELREAFSDKTKLLIINSPHNPTGRVFTPDELQVISKNVIKHDVYVMSDEVYEYLVFDERRHIPIATLEGMGERTITISSLGKTFGMTGWKIGWASVTVDLISSLQKIHQYNVFSVSTPMQYAALEALNGLSTYIPQFKKEYQEKRDILEKGLNKLGIETMPVEGTYFIMTKIPDSWAGDDFEYCMNVLEKKGVAMIPPSSFYLKSQEGKKLARLCFAKDLETIRAALTALK